MKGKGRAVTSDSDEGRNMSGSVETTTLQVLVRERIDQWREGGQPDAAEFLEEHPELRSAKGLVLDLVLAEYALRTAAGDAVKRGEFYDRFPTYRQSIARMLQVQDFLDKCPGCNSANGAAEEEPAQWPLLGQEFLGYELVEPLGRGGLARVYLARETKVGGRWVVVKISRYGSQEAAALGKVSHPSVAPIYSLKHDTAGEWTLICMPLLGVATGIDLLDAAFAAGAERNGALVERVAVQTRPLTAIRELGDKHPESTRGTEFTWDLTYGEAIARLGLQLAEGLKAAHAAGIMHRDIKPSNILLAWSGRAMLLDFNLATDASAADAGFGGTLAYMAPEMVEALQSIQDSAFRVQQEAGDRVRETERTRLEALNVDPRCDVYSLGAVLFELLTGRLPAEPANAEKLSPVEYEPWQECKRAKIQAPADAGVEPRLMAIVLKCLDFDPAARYASAAELATELRGYLQRAARPRAMRKQIRRAVLAAAVAMVVVGGGAWAYVGTRPLTAEQLYQRGLAEYEQGKYEQAVGTFTQCLERRSGWTEALFGRGQSLLRLQKWGGARTDFSALRTVNPAWSHALVGYCSMRLHDDGDAFIDFSRAQKEGLQHTGFLLNFARVATNRQRHVDAIKIYDQVLSNEATNTLAIRNRGLAYVALVWNDKAAPLDPRALDDARECCRLEPQSIESACCAAIILGEAARKNFAFQEEAVRSLKEALRKGMPLEVVNSYPVQLKQLALCVDDQTRSNARHDEKYRIDFRPIHEPPAVANWSVYQAQCGVPKGTPPAKGIAGIPPSVR